MDNQFIAQLKLKCERKKVYMIGYPEFSKDINIPKQALEKPFDFAPKEEFLSDQEEILLNELEKQESWNGNDFLKMLQLRLIKGATDKATEQRRIRLDNLLNECYEYGLKLPPNFILLFQENNIFNRFRLGSSSFNLPRKLTKFPNIEDIFIICFHEDQQCCFRYYMIIDLYGNYCIALNYNDEVFPNEDTFYFKKDLEFFICADSFEEYIYKISYLIKMKSGEMGYPFDA